MWTCHMIEDSPIKGLHWPHGGSLDSTSWGGSEDISSLTRNLNGEGTINMVQDIGATTDTYS